MNLQVVFGGVDLYSGKYGTVKMATLLERNSPPFFLPEIDTGVAYEAVRGSPCHQTVPQALYHHRQSWRIHQLPAWSTSPQTNKTVFAFLLENSVRKRTPNGICTAQDQRQNRLSDLTFCTGLKMFFGGETNFGLPVTGMGMLRAAAGLRRHTSSF